MQKFYKKKMFWVPLITGWIILAFTVLHVKSVQKENEEFYQKIAEQKLSNLQELLSSGIHDQIITLQRLHENWNNNHGLTKDEWSAELKGLFRNDQNMLEVAWISEDREPWIVSQNQKPKLLNERTSAQGQPSNIQVSLKKYSPNVPALEISLHALQNGESERRLIALLDLNEFLNSTISMYLEEFYRFSIRDNSQLIYSYGKLPELNSFDAVSFMTDHGLNLEFTLGFNPDSFNISMLKNSFFILTIGGILSIMIPTLLFISYYENSRNQTLQKLLNVKDEFLYNMSHEIRTPLHGMIASISLLKREGMDPLEERNLNRIRTSSKFLLEIVTNILDHLKMDSGKLKLEEQPQDISSLTYEVIDASIEIANKRNVKMHMYYDETIPNKILCNGVRVKQVLMNLINNAIKFTHEGDVFVRVTRKKNQKIRFEVKDTGIGITEEKQRAVFEKFFQEDCNISRKYGGTGLGLTICRQLVELMGGEIGFSSKKHEGSIFWFEIPLRTSDKLAV